MALFSECMQLCAPKVLDTADIVRDGDFSSTTPTSDSEWRVPAMRFVFTAHHDVVYFTDSYVTLNIQFARKIVASPKSSPAR